MKTLLIIATAALLAGCSLFTPVKTPLQSTPGDHWRFAASPTNGYSLDILDQQNSSYSNLNATINSNGMTSFSASGVVHTMDPGVISMSGASYLASQQAQYAAQQAILAQVISFAATTAAKGALATTAPAGPSQTEQLGVMLDSQYLVMNRMLDIITNLQATALAERNNTNKP